MRIRKKIVNGQMYYYLEETVRLEKAKAYSIFLGKVVPAKNLLEKKKRELWGKIRSSLQSGASKIYLSDELLIEAEKRRRRHAVRMGRLGKASLDEKDEVDTVDFVYTTLTTEGVPVTVQDANLAYKFKEKNVKSVRDENLRVALDMIKGLRFVKESGRRLSLAFILELHKTIMAEYPGKNPGKLRQTQAYIYLKSYEKVEEIGFRPPAPSETMERLVGLAGWYNENAGKLNVIELAALLHLRFYMIHPFEDGNKRVARLLLNKALFDSGYPLLNISKETQGYFDALIKSVEKKDEKPFAEFVCKRFVESV